MTATLQTTSRPLGPVAQHPELQALPEAMAEKLLEAWPEGLFPVDPYKIAAFHGANVYRGQIPGDVSGLLIKEVGVPAAIWVDVDDSEVRRRFSAAHELGHLVAHEYAINASGGDAGKAEFSRVESRGSLSSLGTDPDEKFANAFAAALLMPEPTVRELYSAPGITMGWLARYFNVSKEAMTNRLKNLGLVPR